jgi:hypothetical protein
MIDSMWRLRSAVALSLTLAVGSAAAGPAATSPRLTRRCEQLLSIHSDAVVEQAQFTPAKLRRVGPSTVRFGFVPGGDVVLYADSEVSALYAVPLATGEPRRLSSDGQMVANWWPDPKDPGRVVYQTLKPGEIRGDFYSVSLSTPEVPSPSKDVAEARLAPFREILGQHGHRSVQYGSSSVDLWFVSDSFAVAGIGTVAEDQQLFAVDLHAGKLRPLMLPSMRVIWSPFPLAGQRIVFQARDKHLYVSDLRTGELQCASTQPDEGFEISSFLATSRDGRWLAYVAMRFAARPEAPFEVHIVDLVEGIDRLVAQGKAQDVFPTLLREKGQLELMTRIGTGEKFAAVLYTLGPNTPPVRRTEPQPQVPNVLASPDGKRLIFSRGLAKNPFALPLQAPPPREPPAPQAPVPGTGLYVLEL